MNRAPFDLGPESMGDLVALAYELFGHLSIGQIAGDLVEELGPIIKRFAQSIRQANRSWLDRLKAVFGVLP